MQSGSFVRLRRTRRNKIIRDLVAETTLSASQLILPLFVTNGSNIELQVNEMPGVYAHSIDILKKIVESAITVGVRSIMLFPRDPGKRSFEAEEAYNPENLICRAVRALKRDFGGDLVIITDIAADPYTIDGHDGFYRDGKILNDETLELLIKQALVQAAAGSDMLAPSDMMDGRIFAIRNALNLAEFDEVPIVSYSAKYASNFYAPFRDALGSTNIILDKRSYQMDYRNSKEAMREIEVDINEGADIVMIKPASFYLDIIKMATDRFCVPIFAYQVSGEYKMLVQYGGLEVLLESLIAIRRAGAAGIVTYAAIEVAKYLPS
ncbi:porphobilinogen synthase [Neorickettsia sennetsu]|uniref:Delta-aminolevulinic acid dehydratase n=1 Tax=Ehrlichia sennetsu (strain ATCC VR-367 / Miyayama) TaxID=222891 RepID=Q2GE15_EHRS3|nr:porphobilinogen synthase [Neorickettsia sennetsu]ABD45854.1 porphobilinogen synthase [Neorickettsia sennetsu str. Miyayama]